MSWEDELPNTVVTVGKNLILDQALAGAAYTVTGPFMGLISSTSFSAIAAADTMASHSGWLEAGNANAPIYTSPRKTCAWSSASGGSKALSAALGFAITGTGTSRAWRARAPSRAAARPTTRVSATPARRRRITAIAAMIVADALAEAGVAVDAVTYAVIAELTLAAAVAVGRCSKRGVRRRCRGERGGRQRQRGDQRSGRRRRQGWREHGRRSDGRRGGERHVSTYNIDTDVELSSAFVTLPDNGAATAVQVADLTHAGIGVFTYVVLANKAGRWSYQFKGDGNVEVTSPVGSFYVLPGLVR